MKRIRRRLFKIAFGLLVAILIAKGAIVTLRWNDPINQFRRSLADRHEERSESDEFGDYSLYISGNLPASRFRDMAELLGLIGDIREDPGQLEGWQIVDKTWWQLPRTFDEQYYKRGSSYSVLFGRSEDRVFYQALSW